MSTWQEQARENKRLNADIAREDRNADREYKLKAAELKDKQRREQQEADRKRADKQAADERRRKEQRKAERKAARKRLIGTVTAHTTVPGALPVIASMILAWGGQMDAAAAMGMGAYSPLVPVMAEGLTLALMILTTRAMTAGKPSGRLMAFTWVSALLAAGINAFGHISEATPGAGVRAVLFAVGSLVGVGLWWVVATANRTRKTKAERAAEKERAKHCKARRKKFPKVAKRCDAILAAYPLGTITEEEAWKEAWLDEHAMPIARTADVVERFQKAEAVAESLSAVSLRRDFRAGVDDWLDEVLDEGSGGSAKVAPRKPSGGPSEGATALAGIEKEPVRDRAHKGDTEPLDTSDLKAARKLYTASPTQFSTPAVRKLLGKSAAYAKRVRDAVIEQEGTS
ncbi:DUF2637 domain-containing protein [Streptomyces sp. BH106]|uniref:DUF2637 domain-containing protein n=1 Tax=Streptomyces sp. BH106 TaxID=3410409 RepID=UPI003CEA1F9B